jgi:acyl CoA:acetate/3-ketoacid CoA transferase beta subunit
VIEVTPDGLLLREIAADTTIEKVQAATGARLILADKVGSFV